MKIRIDLDENLEEEEIIIKCKKIDPSIQQIQEAISDITSTTQKLSFYKEESEYYLPLEDILFFETSDNKINAHTQDDTYFMKYRLYELEELLPKYFLRISKSTIANTNKVFSITHTLGSPNIVQFYNSHKQVYVSRLYFKELKYKLGERR